MRKLMIMPLCAAMLAGCGTPAGNQSAPVAESGAVEANAIGNGVAPENALAAVLALTDRERDGVFMRALTDAGLPCDGVSGSERLADRDGQPLWRATCKGVNGTNHLITVTPDGIAHIVSRTDR